VNNLAELKWITAKITDLPSFYPDGKCPKCGWGGFEVCDNWTPKVGLDPQMKLVRCNRVTGRFPHENMDEEGDIETVWVNEYCHQEYYLSPVIMGHGAKECGNVL
jgi:hypothetical protein